MNFSICSTQIETIEDAGVVKMTANAADAAKKADKIEKAKKAVKATASATESPSGHDSEAKKAQPPITTPQRLGALMKSAWTTMRKDKGLNGDLDRLPILTWLMFLKFLDDLEVEREVEAEMAGIDYQPIIDAPYRWRDWATGPNPTGDELLAFISQEMVDNPFGHEDDPKIPGLFSYLRSLTETERELRLMRAAKSLLPYSRESITGCDPVTCCARSLGRSTRSTSTRQMSSIRSECSMRGCSGR